MVAGDEGASLRAENVQLAEDGREIPTTLRRLPTEDLELVLVMDTSGSMDGAPMAAAKQAAVSFLERLPEDVDVSVLGFGSEPVLAAGFSADRTEAVSAVSALEANGETALYDALVAGSEVFSEGNETRRALILLSDGGDTVSSASFDDAATALQGAGVDFYAVALEGSEFDITPLSGLTDITEGQIAAAEDPEALAGIYESLASQLINRYRVSYRSQAHGPTTISLSFASENETLQASRTVEMPAATPPPTTTPQATTPSTTVRNHGPGNHGARASARVVAHPGATGPVECPVRGAGAVLRRPAGRRARPVRASLAPGESHRPLWPPRRRRGEDDPLPLVEPGQLCRRGRPRPEGQAQFIVARPGERGHRALAPASSVCWCCAGH